MFEFIHAEKADFSTKFMCERLGVTRQGYYQWRKRPPCQRPIVDAAYTAVIKRIHTESRNTYGAPRVHAELADDYNIRCGRKRVARLMRNAGLVGCHRRKKVWTTKRDRSVAPAPDRVKRDFTAAAPNELWVADITYIPTLAGFGYLATVLDVFSRRIVGWSYANHMRTRLIVDAIDMAVEQRKPAPGLVHHSDQGTQDGINRSLQHLDTEVSNGKASWMDERVDGALGNEVARRSETSSGSGTRVLESGRNRSDHKRRCGRAGCRPSCGVALVPAWWRNASHGSCTTLWPLPLTRRTLRDRHPASTEERRLRDRTSDWP